MMKGDGRIQHLQGCPGQGQVPAGAECRKAALLAVAARDSRSGSGSSSTPDSICVKLLKTHHRCKQPEHMIHLLRLTECARWCGHQN